MAADTKSSSLVRLKPSSSDRPSSSSKLKIDSSASKKKLVESSIKISATDTKNRSTNNVSKMTKKTTTQTKVEVKTVTKTRQKKVYSLAGQKFDVPEEREPLRLFYESLSKQIPSSEMAEFWLMEHGLLSPERSKKAFEKKQRKQKQIRMGTPVKSPPPYVSNKPNLNKGESSKKTQQQAPKNGEVSNKPNNLNKGESSKKSQQQAPKNGEVSNKPNNLNKGESSKKPQQQAPKNGEVKAKKRLVNDSDDDDDFMLSHKRRKA